MRRFATWCTGHRKTVIIGWIVALIGVGMLAGSVGSDFSEEFKLPASDSQEAFDLLETKFPAQSGDTATIVFKADAGVESPAVERKMDAVFAAVAKVPHVSEVASPYSGDGAAAISEDGKIAYATVQFDEPANEIGKGNIKRVSSAAQGAGGDGLQVEVGGQPIEEVRAEEEGGDSTFAIGLLAAVVILLLTFGSVVAMGLPIVTALFALGVGLSLVTLGTHVFDTAEFAPQLAAMIGLGVGIDYALFIVTRFRNGSRRGHGAAARRDRGDRHRRPRRAVRGRDGDHRPDGDVPARPLLPLRGRDGRRPRRADDDDRGADPAAGAADDRRAAGRPAAHPGPGEALLSQRRGHPLVPLEPRDPAPPAGWRRSSPAAS